MLVLATPPQLPLPVRGFLGDGTIRLRGFKGEEADRFCPGCSNLCLLGKPCKGLRRGSNFLGDGGTFSDRFRRSFPCDSGESGDVTHAYGSAYPPGDTDPGPKALRGLEQGVRSKLKVSLLTDGDRVRVVDEMGLRGDRIPLVDNGLRGCCMSDVADGDFGDLGLDEPESDMLKPHNQYFCSNDRR